MSRAARSRLALFAASCAALAGLSVGCVKQSPTLSKAPPASVEAAREHPAGELHIDDLTAKSKAFTELAKQVRLATTEQDRPLMQQVFTSLTQILPQLAGSRQGGVFAHQLSVVEDTRAQLAARSASLSAGPIVENGLLATRAALADASQNYYFAQDPQIEKSLQDLATKLDDLRVTGGASHPLLAGDAVVIVSDVIAKMTAVLAERIAEGGPAAVPGAAPAGTTPPATPPPANPTTPETPAVPVPPPSDPAPAPTPPPADPATPVVPPEAPAPAPTPPPADPAAPAATPPVEPAPAPPAAPADENK